MKYAKYIFNILNNTRHIGRKWKWMAKNWVVPIPRASRNFLNFKKRNEIMSTIGLQRQFHLSVWVSRWTGQRIFLKCQKPKLMGASPRSDYRKKKSFLGDVFRSPGKLNWNHLSFLPFIFFFEQCKGAATTMFWTVLWNVFSIFFSKSIFSLIFL